MPAVGEASARPTSPSQGEVARHGRAGEGQPRPRGRPLPARPPSGRAGATKGTRGGSPPRASPIPPSAQTGKKLSTVAQTGAAAARMDLPIHGRPAARNPESRRVAHLDFVLLPDPAAFSPVCTESLTFHPPPPAPSLRPDPIRRRRRRLAGFCIVPPSLARLLSARPRCRGRAGPVHVVHRRPRPSPCRRIAHGASKVLACPCRDDWVSGRLDDWMTG